MVKTEGHYMGLHVQPKKMPGCGQNRRAVYVQLKKVPGCAQNRTLWS